MALCEVPKLHRKDCVKSPANFPQETFFWKDFEYNERNYVHTPRTPLSGTGGSSGGLHCQSGVLVCRAPSPAQASSAAVEPLRESFRVDLNTAGVDAMTTLPGLGEKKARAILEYRLAYGRFQSLDEVAQVSGVRRI